MQTVSMSVIALHATHRLSRTLGHVRLLWPWPEALSTPHDAWSSQPYLPATIPLSSISMPMDRGLHAATSHPYTEPLPSHARMFCHRTVGPHARTQLHVSIYA